MMSHEAMRPSSGEGNCRAGMLDTGALHAAAQERLRGASGWGSCHMQCQTRAHESSSHGCASGSGETTNLPHAWTTGDQDLDHWFETLNLDESVYSRLFLVVDLWNRRHIVQACRDNLARVRSIGAFLNGCISKHLSVKRACKPQARSQRNPYAAAAGVTMSPRRSLPTGKKNFSVRLDDEVPAALSSAAFACTLLPDASSSASKVIDTSPTNDDVFVWQAWSTRVMHSVHEKSKFLREVWQALEHAVSSKLAALPSEWQFTIHAQWFYLLAMANVLTSRRGSFCSVAGKPWTNLEWVRLRSYHRRRLPHVLSFTTVRSWA